MNKSRILIAGLALFVTLICWSLSSPINSHQDEKFHLASIWCADGFDPDCEYQGLSETGVETVLLKVNLCTPTNTEETNYERLLVARAEGKCKFEFVANEALETMDVFPNFFYETDTQIAAWIQPGHTPSVYYKALNLFGGNNAEQSVFRFRLVNSLLFILLLIAFLLVSEQSIRNSALLGLLVTMIPHGLFLITGVPNSGWSFTGCGLSWAFLYILLNQPFRINWKTGLAILGWVVSSGIVISSRYDTIIYLIFTNIAVLIFKISTKTKHKKLNLTVLFMGCLSFAFLAWTRLPKIRGLFKEDLYRSDLPYDFRLVGRSNSPLDLFVVFGNAVKLSIATPLRILGLQPPGWGPLHPSTSVFLVNLIFVVLVAFTLIRTRLKTQTITLFLSFGFLFGVYLLQCYTRRNWTSPFYLIRTSWTGDTFSARYFIPYFPFLFGIMALTSKNFVTIWGSLKFKCVLFTVLAFTQAITLHDIGKVFRENPSWYWQNISIGVQSLFVISTISFAVFLYFVLFPSINDKRVDTL